MIDDIENKIVNLRLQQCSLKNRFLNLVILLEVYMKYEMNGDSNFRIMLHRRLNLS